MTKEQEAIERINRFKTIKVLYGNTFAMTTEQLRALQEDIETALNMLKEKDKEIEKLKEFINYLQLKNIKNLDMIIYMANFINDNTPYTKDTKELENEEGIRTVDFTVKYFERKSEE